MLIARIQGCFESGKIFYSWHARCEMEEEGNEPGPDKWIDFRRRKR